MYKYDEIFHCIYMCIIRVLTHNIHVQKTQTRERMIFA
jgi:hypothetical protein